MGAGGLIVALSCTKSALAVRISRDCPNCKVMLLSGHGSIIDLLADAEADGRDFVLVDKPVHPAVLIEKIGEVLHGITLRVGGG